MSTSSCTSVGNVDDVPNVPKTLIAVGDTELNEIKFRATSNAVFGTLLDLYAEKMSVPRDPLRLFFGGAALSAECTVGESGVSNGSKVWVVATGVPVPSWIEDQRVMFLVSINVVVGSGVEKTYGTNLECCMWAQTKEEDGPGYQHLYGTRGTPFGDVMDRFSWKQGKAPGYYKFEVDFACSYLMETGERRTVAVRCKVRGTDTPGSLGLVDGVDLYAIAPYRRG